MFNNHLAFKQLRASNYLRAYYLRAYKEPLHLSRNLYKSALSLQNKPNLLNTQMNVKSFHTADYENKSNRKLGENKPNTKPNKPNLLDDQMNVNKVLTKDYENETAFRLRQNKPNQTQSPLNWHNCFVETNLREFLAKFLLSPDFFRNSPSIILTPSSQSDFSLFWRICTYSIDQWLQVA